MSKLWLSVDLIKLSIVKAPQTEILPSKNKNKNTVLKIFFWIK